MTLKSDLKFEKLDDKYQRAIKSNLAELEKNQNFLFFERRFNPPVHKEIKKWFYEVKEGHDDFQNTIISDDKKW